MPAGLMDPPFEALESQIEGLWREILGNDLKLYPLKQVRPLQGLA